MFHQFHLFHGVYMARRDLYVPPVPRGVYGWERFACSTSSTCSTCSTGCVWMVEVSMFHVFHLFHPFHGVYMAGGDLHFPPVPRGVHGLETLACSTSSTCSACSYYFTSSTCSTCSTCSTLDYCVRVAVQNCGFGQYSHVPLVPPGSTIYSQHVVELNKYLAILGTKSPSGCRP